MHLMLLLPYSVSCIIYTNIKQFLFISYFVAFIPCFCFIALNISNYFIRKYLLSYWSYNLLPRIYFAFLFLFRELLNILGLVFEAPWKFVLHFFWNVWMKNRHTYPTREFLNFQKFRCKNKKSLRHFEIFITSNLLFNEITDTLVGPKTVPDIFKSIF